MVARGSKELARVKQGTQLCAGRGWVGWLSDCGLVAGRELTPLSYCLGKSLLSGSFHCQQDGFALSLLAGKGDSKWDSAAPEVNFS